MTKKEAEIVFAKYILPTVSEPNGIDIHKRNEAWGKWTDGLCKNKMITKHQFNSWTNPEWFKKIK